MWGLAYPGLTRQCVNFMVDMYRDGGLIPRGPAGHNYSFVMIAAHSTPFIVGAYMKGIRDFDVEAAYEGMRKNALPGGLMGKAGYEHNTCTGGGIEDYIELGYIPDDRKGIGGWHADGAPQTLEYAYDDWCLAQMAKALGKEDDYRLFIAPRRQLPQPVRPADRLHAAAQPRRLVADAVRSAGPPRDGAKATPGSTPGSCRTTSQGLIELMGGREAFNRKLNEAFEQARLEATSSPQYVNYGNQPSIQMAHLFNYSGAPWLTQKWVREVKEQTFGGTTPETRLPRRRRPGPGGRAGRDDGHRAVPDARRGGPATRSTRSPARSSTASRSTSTRATTPASRFVIVARDNSPENHYIQSATLDGQPLDKPWFYHRELVDGGTLVLDLGPEPNKNRQIRVCRRTPFDVQ